MYLDEQVKQGVEARLGRKVPDPADPAFDKLLEELYATDPELAATLQGGVIFEAVGDPREASLKAERRAQRKRSLRAALFMKPDQYTGELLISKTKVSSWALLALLLVLGLAFWYNRATFTALTHAASMTEAPADVAQGETTVSEETLLAVEEATSSPRPRTAVLESVDALFQPTDPASPADPTTASGGEETVAITEGAAETGPYPAALPPAASPTPAATEPLESSVVAQRGSMPLVAVTYMRPAPGNPDILRNAVPAASALTNIPSPATPAPAAIQPTTGAPGGGAGSAIVFRRDSPTQPPLASEATPTPAAAVDPLQSALAAPVPFYKQPAVSASVATPSGEAPSQGSSYAVGDTLAARLETGVMTVEEERVPVVARAGDGSVWQGQALLSSVGRIEMTFVLVGNSEVTALAYDENDALGLKATVRNEAPALAADLIAASLRGVTDYVGALSKQQTIVQNGETVIVESETPPLEWSVASSVAGLFSPSESQRALVRVGELQAGTPFTLRVMGELP